MIRAALPVAGRPVCRRGTVLPFLAADDHGCWWVFWRWRSTLACLQSPRRKRKMQRTWPRRLPRRTLNGDPTNTYNQGNATTNATKILSYNNILGQSIQASSQLTINLQYGSYDYSQSSQTFSANFPATTGQPYTAVNATITVTNLPNAFSTIFGLSFLPSVSASRQAVHRPRDVALVMDLSGSMRWGLAWASTHSPQRARQPRVTNNPDTNVPTFGHYSSSNAGLTGTTSTRSSATDSYSVALSNFTVTNTSYNLLYINSFYSNAAYASTLVRAFDSSTSTDNGKTWAALLAPPRRSCSASTYATTPGGDVPMFKSGSTSIYAQHVQDVVSSEAAQCFVESGWLFQLH